MKTTMAYLAGAIDSDGTIGVKKSTYAMRVVGDSKQAVYSERVALRQVTSEIVDILRETFGGSVYMTKPSCAKGQPLYSWAVTDLAAFQCLRSLSPFLKVKQKQARNAMGLRPLKAKSSKLRVARGRGHVGGASRTPEISAAMEAIYLEAKRLNAVGC